MQKKSKIFGLNTRDYLYSLIIAVIGAMLTALQELLSAEVFVFTMTIAKKMLLFGINAGLAYIIKNFVSNSKGEFAKKERSLEPAADGPGGSNNPDPIGRPPKPEEQP